MAKNSSELGFVSRVWRAVNQYLFPPRCISCGDTVAAGSLGDAKWSACFCRECMADFLASCRCECSECGKTLSACECSTPNLTPLGITRVYSSFEYDKSKRKSAASTLIFKLKGGENRDVIDFAAELLSSRIEKALDREGIDEDNAVITFAPRRRAAVRTEGVDHMKLAAESAGKRLDIECKPLFDNTSLKSQKSRNADSRTEAAQRSIKPRRGIEKAVAGKNVILVDDIMTSGATLSACAAALFCAGASSVTVCVLAKSAKDTYFDV